VKIEYEKMILYIMYFIRFSGIIAGAVVGSIALITILVLVFLCCYAHYKKRGKVVSSVITSNTVIGMFYLFLKYVVVHQKQNH